MLGQHSPGMVVLTGIRTKDMRVWLNVAMKGRRMYHGGWTNGADISWQTQSIGEVNDANVIVITSHVNYYTLFK